MEVGGTNRALVIGAQGVLGAFMVDAFEAAGWVVRSGARRPRPGQIAIDLGLRDSIAAAMDEHELVVNTVPHPDLLAERYILEHGGALINVSDLPAAAARSLRAVAGGARGTVVMNAGLAPGVTTIVAGHLLGLHPAASELEIVFTLSLSASRGPESVNFIHRGLTAVPRHRTALVRLPSPFDERHCLGFGEGDAGWLGGVAEGRIVRQYVCVAEPAVHERLLALNSAGAMTNLPRSIIEAREQGADGTAGNEPVAHWVAAIRAGRRLDASTVECVGGSLSTARSTLVFADALRSEPPPSGCFNPEEIWTLTGIEAKAASRRNLGRITAVNRVEDRGDAGAARASSPLSAP
jgi:NAD(P)-dependent dehydrogenase (short-subunit alcohol dehydrogenase family)